MGLISTIHLRLPPAFTGACALPAIRIESRNKLVTNPTAAPVFEVPGRVDRIAEVRGRFPLSRIML